MFPCTYYIDLLSFLGIRCSGHKFVLQIKQKEMMHKRYREETESARMVMHLLIACFAEKHDLELA